jgi:L-threonylcarbamoyladenylate synthase
MKAIPGPLLSTSANISGQETPPSVAELKELLLDEVDLFVDGGEVLDPMPSTVVDLSVSPPQVVRPGRLGPRSSNCSQRQEVAAAVAPIELPVILS